jgi:peroxiredoxin
MLMGFKLNARELFNIRVHIPDGYQGISIVLKPEIDSIGNFKVVSEKNNTYLLKGDLSSKFLMAFLSIKQGEESLLYELVCLKAGVANIFLSAGPATERKLMLKKSELPFSTKIHQYGAMVRLISDSLTIVDRNKIIMRMKGYSIDSQKTQDSIMVGLRRNLLSQKMNFIKENAGDFISLFFFRRDILFNLDAMVNLPVDSLIDIYQLFPEENRESRLGQIVKEELDTRLSLQLSRPAPDFSITTSIGEIFKLSDYRGLLVLVCFWDSNCRPCIESFPILRVIDSSYSGKGFEMISVSLDQNEELWRMSLDRYKPTWRQAVDLPKYRSNAKESMGHLYRIGYYPQYFLIDDRGTIIYHNDLSHDDSTYSVLKKTIRSNLK